MSFKLDKIKHYTYLDNRGSYTPIDTKELGVEWNQCSISINENPFTFRGLHYQTNPPQTKYIKVIQGEIIDFAVKLDGSGEDYVVLSDSEAVLIPNDCAHGFLTLQPNTIVAYLVEGEYNPESEHSIPYTKNEWVYGIINAFVGDMDIAISEKDKVGK